MDLFQRSDEAWLAAARDADLRRAVIAKARVNRGMTLAATVALLVAFFLLSLFETPAAEIIGVIAAINFTLFLKSDAEVKQLLLLEQKSGKGPEGAKKDGPKGS